MFNAFLHSIYSQTHLNLVDDILWACTKCEVKKKTRVINFHCHPTPRGCISNIVLIILMHRLSMLIKYFILHFLLAEMSKEKSFHSKSRMCFFYNMIFSMRLNRFDIIVVVSPFFHSFEKKPEVCLKYSIHSFNIIAKLNNRVSRSHL